VTYYVGADRTANPLRARNADREHLDLQTKANRRPECTARTAPLSTLVSAIFSFITSNHIADRRTVQSIDFRKLLALRRSHPEFSAGLPVRRHMAAHSGVSFPRRRPHDGVRDPERAVSGTVPDPMAGGGLPLRVPLADGRNALIESVHAVVAALDGLDEWDLFTASRCHGWSRLDVGTHLLAGWQEMLAGMACPVDAEPTVDAASFWTAFAADNAGQDRVAVLLAQRRRSDAHTRPDAMRAQLRDVAAAVVYGAEAMSDRPVHWAGQVFAPGDFLTTWAVEDVVHQLDLDLGDDLPAGALALARRTVESLAGPLPAAWPDAHAVLVGTGRLPAPADAGPAGERLPALG